MHKYFSFFTHGHGDTPKRPGSIRKKLLRASRLLTAAITLVVICLGANHVAGQGTGFGYTDIPHTLAASTEGGQEHTDLDSSAMPDNYPTSATNTNATSFASASTASTCSHANYGLSASPLVLTSAGLTSDVDTPDYYMVNGKTATEIGRQLRACGSAINNEGYIATTAYWLGAYYRIMPTPAGMCRLADIGVGVHVVQTMPAWNSTPQDSAMLRAKWQHFTTNLQSHEDGHTVIILGHASSLQRKLESRLELSCSSVREEVATMIRNEVALITAANDTYDHITAHGATQGAIW